MHLSGRTLSLTENKPILSNYIASQENYDADCWSIYGDLFDEDDYDDEDCTPLSGSACLAEADEHIDRVILAYLECRISLDIDDIITNLQEKYPFDLYHHYCLEELTSGPSKEKLVSVCLTDLFYNSEIRFESRVAQSLPNFLENLYLFAVLSI